MSESTCADLWEKKSIHTECEEKGIVSPYEAMRGSRAKSHTCTNICTFVVESATADTHQFSEELLKHAQTHNSAAPCARTQNTHTHTQWHAQHTYTPSLSLPLPQVAVVFLSLLK